MIHQVLVCVLIVGSTVSANLLEARSYAKVSKNGQGTEEVSSKPDSQVMSGPTPGNFSTMHKAEGRSAQDIVITVSPVYVSPRSSQLRKGEAVDYPTTKKYSTLDEEMVSRLDVLAARKQAQDRFHPPAVFEHEVAHANAIRQQQANPISSRPSASSSSSGPSPSQLDFPGSYDYKPISNPAPLSIDGYPPAGDSTPELPGSYGPPADSYGPDSYGSPSGYLHGHGQDHRESDPELDHEVHGPEFGSGPIYGQVPPKPIEYAGHFDHPAFVDDSYAHDHDYHQEIIYDHIPEDHIHHTTEQPEMNDQRLNKKPYSYYFIGKKLWYLPLYFSIYFIIYIAALVLKSIARHKINFPTSLAEAAAGAGRNAKDHEGPGWWDLTVRVFKGIEESARRFGKAS